MGREGIKRASVYWTAGNLFQCLWCFCFRPNFEKALYLPAALLALGAVSLFGAHGELTRALSSGRTIGSKIALGLLRFPISLHASWLTAASLLNLNGWAAASGIDPAKNMALATFSAYSAIGIGAFLTVMTSDAGVGLTFAWALAALADKTMKSSDVMDIAGIVAVHSLGITEKYGAYFLVALAVLYPSGKGLLLGSKLF